LADPLRVITILTTFVGVFVGLITWPASGIWAALGITCSMLSFALLIAPAGKPNAIYLRAFKTDKSTAALRSKISAILGPGFRLSGIRPPRKKSSVFLRFLLPGIVAMRYAGSKYMELEAGDDWMARLWKTYQTVRLVLIDVREVTPYVHQEIEMTLQSVGSARCVFLVNREKTEGEWRKLLAEIVGPESDSEKLQLLDVSPERVAYRQMESDLRDLVKTLPEGVPGALAEGRQFVLDHVSEELISRSSRPSAMTVISALVALALSIGFGIAWVFIPRDNSLIPYLVLLLLMPIFGLWASSIYRVVMRAVGLGRAGHTRAAIRAWSAILIVLVLFVAGPALNFVQAAWGADAPLVQSKKQAYEISAIASLRSLNTAEIQYSSSFPKGYACSLPELGGDPSAGQATAQGAQLIPEDLATGTKSGYRFNIPECTKSTQGGQSSVTHYMITAVPTAPGRPPMRGFCTDESGEIRFDPNGGTNCTQLMP
jgi:type IV pilus assembly protein PilA